MKPASHLPKITELDALETRMGEIASLLSEMADALTCYPEAIRIAATDDNVATGDGAACVTLQAREWPSIQDLEQLVSNWRQMRAMVDRA